ncbi:MAG: hypothetical protein KME15_26385 [Drouetiella hepatica Uher 2000/2452]|jgi:hypothetical protein|uniref:Uncharacterized protein n=1 Tax=Drouetiella hepatica Uher 2000/2452 TaxID=904376 RepID=A0A951UPP9_9CYAN|nr:hypothetical protein [Drouetiella hepatica Uher 2000/2452]
MNAFESIAWVTLAAFCLQQMKIVDVAGVLKDNGIDLPKVEQVSSPSELASPATSAAIAPSPTPSVSPSPEATGAIAP